MSMSQELVQRIKDANDIVTVISERLTLTKKGVNHVGICPFHVDKAPSLTVSGAKQFYKCFACGAGGDVIKFVTESDGLTFYEALNWLAKRAGIDMPMDTDQTPEEKSAAKQREYLFVRTRTDQAQFIQNQSKKPFLNYLALRDITLETATAFGMGLCETGYFANRITYPFYDISGNVVGHTGRAIDWVKGGEEAKFKNSAESAIYHKRRVLYGLIQAKKAIQQSGKAYIVEGQNDVVIMHQKGFANTVGGSGTAFTEEQARLLFRFTNQVTLMLDSDKAGKAATLLALPILLTAGFSVRVITLPEGEDPDSFARKFEHDKLAIVLHQMEKSWFDYITELYPYSQDTDEYERNIVKVLDFITVVTSDIKRNDYIQKVCELFQIGADLIKKRLKPTPKVESWKDGVYGFDEAKEIADEYNKVGIITFSSTEFVNLVNEEPIIYYKGKPQKYSVQLLRKRFQEFRCNPSLSGKFSFGAIETDDLQVLVMMHLEGIKVIMETSDPDNPIMAFTDWYITNYSAMFPSIASVEKSEYMRRCLAVIAYTEPTMRTMNANVYIKLLGLTTGNYNELLKPLLTSKKDKNELEKQRVDMQDSIMDFDPGEIPVYVEEDEVLSKVYRQSGFYPLIKKDKTPCAYMFKNEKGDGHSCISDFYMVPLLHIYSNDDAANKRVLQLNHTLKKPIYVEWQSSILANLQRVKEKLVNAGYYNFEGSLLQFQKIWKNMSYGFTTCTELKTFGQQPEEFWAFTNAIYHQVEIEDEQGKRKVNKIEYVDDLGVTTHKGNNYYSPAFSKIFIDERRDSDIYEQDRYFVYKEIPENDRVDFARWSHLMNDVYSINDNGKWAVLFDILCCFRDYIYSQKKFFTTLFFIGPTGSGKSQLAYSMRSLFMSPDAPVFNLNSGTDAAFFMVLERNRNVLAIMEEYNDNNISQAKFQGLKSAILDGEGKIKVKDMANKTLDSSKINAIPLPLGQEAPQQDDGSLSNRSILCDVPYKEKGEFSAHEIQIFDDLKEHERIGLSNVLLEVLATRPIVKKNYISVFNEELKKVKEAISISVANTEGLTRVVNSITMLVAMCRLVEDYTELKLPFTYKEFFTIACDKILRQMETIGKANKLSNYFETIAFLITQGSIKIGRELKVVIPKGSEITVTDRTAGTKVVHLPNPNTKVLYIHFESIYLLYARAVTKGSLSQQSLRAYFESNPAYLGTCKNTKFIWYEEKLVPRKITDEDGNEKLLTDRIMEKKVNSSSAYVFNYNILVDLMQIDFERQDDTPTETPIACADANAFVPDDTPF